MFKLIFLLLACLQVASCQESLGSHVQQYGDLSLANKHLDFFMATPGPRANKQPSQVRKPSTSVFREGHVSLPQHDADLMYFRHKATQHPEGSKEHAEARRELEKFTAKRGELDKAFKNIRVLLQRRNFRLNEVRPQGSAVVDDWDCYRSAIQSFELHCGKLNEYGLSKARLLANICNSGMPSQDINTLCSQACSDRLI